MHRLLLILTLTILISGTKTYGQDYAEGPYALRSSYGIFINGGLNIHAPDFDQLPPSPSCCPGYRSGSGLGYSGGLFFAFPVSDDLEINLRASYMNLSGKLTETETDNVHIFNPATNRGVPGEIEHTIDASLTSVAFNPLISWRMGDQFRLHFGLNGAFLLDKKFDQKEEIVSPDFGVFRDTQQKERFVLNGQEIKNASPFLAAVTAGASMDFPMNSNHTLFLVPEFWFNYGLNNVSSDVDWKIHQLTGGIALRYAPREEIIPEPPPPPPQDPPMPELSAPPSAPVLDATVTAVGVNSNDVESDVSILRVEEFLFNRMHPILNYVFFDENSAELPDRYMRMSETDRDDFSVRELYDYKTMEVYNHVLNIVGKRMQFYPQARVTLVGCNADTGPEEDNLELSRNRAETVRDYLVNVWDIPQDKITIEARNLPELPSNPKNPDGMEENRRVEILANIPQVFEPMIIRDTLREANPPHIRFKMNIHADIGVKSWKLVTMQQGKQLRVFSGTGEPPAKIDWNLQTEDEQDFIPRFTEPLNYNLQIVDNDNKKWESELQTLPVDQVTIEKKMFEMIEDKEIDRFSLIMFGFDRAELTEANERIAEFAQKRIRPNSTVKIKGFSDRVGDPDYNMKLSRRRALATAEVLDIDPKNAAGYGETELLYDNDLPEGRFYSRTVTIEIVTTIQ